MRAESPALRPSASFLSFSIKASPRDPLGTGGTAGKAPRLSCWTSPETRGGPLAPTNKEEALEYRKALPMPPALGYQGDKPGLKLEN